MATLRRSALATVEAVFWAVGIPSVYCQKGHLVNSSRMGADGFTQRRQSLLCVRTSVVVYLLTQNVRPPYRRQ